MTNEKRSVRNFEKYLSYISETHVFQFQNSSVGRAIDPRTKQTDGVGSRVSPSMLYITLK